MKKRLLFGGLILSLPMLIGCQPVQTSTLNLYTDRHYEVDQQLFDAYEEATGITIQVLKMDADALITRLENEGDASPADLIFLTDAGRLGRAKSKGLFQPFDANLLPDNYPKKYTDTDKHWLALTKRARVLVYHPDRMDADSLSTYEALASQDLRIATRSSSHVYNQSLVASLALLLGEEATKSWLSGLVERFAIRDPLTQSRQPVGNDRDQAKAVFANQADVAMMNTYYMGRMLTSSDPLEVEVAETLSVFFPNQSTTGTHVNISGIGLSATTPKQEQAEDFIKFLLATSSQRIFADENFEYPILNDMEPHPLLQSWGPFVEQDIDFSAMSMMTETVYPWMIEAGWN